MLNDEIKLDLLQRGTRITTGEKAALKGIGFALGVDRIVLAVRKQSGLD